MYDRIDRCRDVGWLEARLEARVTVGVAAAGHALAHAVLGQALQCRQAAIGARRTCTAAATTRADDEGDPCTWDLPAVAAAFEVVRYEILACMMDGRTSLWRCAGLACLPSWSRRRWPPCCRAPSPSTPTARARHAAVHAMSDGESMLMQGVYDAAGLPALLEWMDAVLMPWLQCLQPDPAALDGASRYARCS